MDRIDPADPTDRIDPTDPTDRNEPTENSDPAEKTELTDRYEPIDDGARHDGTARRDRQGRPAGPRRPDRAAVQPDRPELAEPDQPPVPA